MDLDDYVFQKDRVVSKKPQKFVGDDDDDDGLAGAKASAASKQSALKKKKKFMMGLIAIFILMKNQD